MMAPIRNGDDNGHGRRKLYDWLFSQGVSTVLLVGILLCIGYLGQYTLTTGIPKHLQTIQEGYERIQADNHKQQQELLERMKEDRQRDRDWFSLEREKDRAEWSRIIERGIKRGGP